MVRGELQLYLEQHMEGHLAASRTEPETVPGIVPRDFPLAKVARPSYGIMTPTEAKKLKQLTSRPPSRSKQNSQKHHKRQSLVSPYVHSPSRRACCIAGAGSDRGPSRVPPSPGSPFGDTDTPRAAPLGQPTCPREERRRYGKG